MMNRISIEILARQGNAAVVQMNDRKHPALLIQGDTLHTLVELAIEAHATCASNASLESQQALQDLLERLQDAQNFYEAALRAHNLEKPYV